MMERIGAVILAAGSGRRMNSAVPKQFLTLCGLPVYLHSVRLFDQLADRIILVTSADAAEECRRTLESEKLRTDWCVITGGSERYLSSMKGVEAALDCDIIAIHDAARACVSRPVLEAALSSAREKGSGVAAVALKDTVKSVDENGQVISTPDRSTMRLIQTPQCFRREIIAEAYRCLQKEIEAGRPVLVTDDAAVVETYTRYPVFLSQGSYENLKLTTPEDLSAAERILEKKQIEAAPAGAEFRCANKNN